MIRHICKLIWHRKRTNLLLITEIFFSVLVLFGVGALGVYMAENWRRPIGFTSENLWLVNVDMRVTGDDTFSASQVETMQRVLAAAREVPEVEKAAGAVMSPYSMGGSSRAYGYQGRQIEFGSNEVTDEFKDVLGLKIVRGRWFGREDDGASYLPVVVNADMAEALFPGQDPIGRNLEPERTPHAPAAPSSPTGPIPQEQRVVGVVAAYREDGEVDGMRLQALYRKPLTDTDPTKRENRPPGNLILRMRPGTTATAEEPLMKHLQAVARGWSFDVKPMSEARASMIAFAAAPVAAIGLVAGFLMLMVALGLTGVLWQNVTQRTREIGLRRAKGAERTSVQRQILGELVVMTSMAVALAAVLVAQVPIVSPFYWVETRVYVVGFIMAAGTIYLLTLLCGWYPSRLATRVEPAEALRYE
jgi:putative ABC transport system permease protein